MAHGRIPKVSVQVFFVWTVLHRGLLLDEKAFDLLDGNSMFWSGCHYFDPVAR